MTTGGVVDLGRGKRDATAAGAADNQHHPVRDRHATIEALRDPGEPTGTFSPKLHPGTPRRTHRAPRVIRRGRSTRFRAQPTRPDGRRSSPMGPDNRLAVPGCASGRISSQDPGPTVVPRTPKRPVAGGDGA